MLVALATLPLLASLAACSGADDEKPEKGKAAPAAKTMTVSGAITLAAENSDAGISSTYEGSCWGIGGYDDIKSGAQVTVRDNTGASVGLGELESSEVWAGETCLLKFSVEDVPAGSGIYSVEVSHRGQISFKESEAADVQLTLG